MPTPSPIDHDVQRCQELAGKIEKPQAYRDIFEASYDLLPHLAAVLAELERLREVEEERRKGDQ